MAAQRAMDEMVMAVESAKLFAAARFQGLMPGGEPWLEHIFEPRNSRFLPRSWAEEDPAWKQVIPYVVLVADGQVFAYRRGRRSTEARLRALHSVGLGGHIRPSDETMFAEPGWAAYQAALERELTEEVELGAAVLRDRLVGLINDDATPVGQVHIGLVHLRELAAPRARARESKITGAGFRPLGALADEGEEMESWSRFVLEGWADLERQAGWQPRLSTARR